MIKKIEKTTHSNRFPKIKILHLLSEPWNDREIQSIKSVSQLQLFDFEYSIMVNKPFNGELPIENCLRPGLINNKLRKGHYGCYLAHRDAILTPEEDEDALLIFEGDCILTIPIEQFVKKVNEAYNILLKNQKMILFSFGWHGNSYIEETHSNHLEVSQFYGAHAYLIPKKTRKFFQDKYITFKWDVTDFWYSLLFPQYRFGIFQNPITAQAAGVSLIDDIFQPERYL